MANTTRLDDRMTELIELWNKRGLSLTESEEFIRLAIPRVESKDIPTEELFQLLLRRTWDAGMSARVVRVLTTAEMRGELMRRMESRLDELASQQEYPATPAESFTVEDAKRAVDGFCSSQGLHFTGEREFTAADGTPMVEVPLQYAEPGPSDCDTEPAPETERVRVDDAWIEKTARSSVTELFDVGAFKAWAAESKRKREAKCDLDHLEILAERRESILYKLLTNSGRSEDLLREMLESLGRIEESLIVSKPPSWKECDHAWVETTGGKRCSVCGVRIMPYLT